MLPRRSFLQSLGGAAASAALSCSDRTEQPARPNIVMILSDDMGYSDVGCYGGEIPTPNIDRLAARGLRFTSHYTNNMCVPTRASLMSGVYPNLALANGRINADCPTVAELLKETGYATYMAGKWHLSGAEYDVPYLPRQRGFDGFYGTYFGANSYFAPGSLLRDNEPADDEYKSNEEYYYTDAVTENAVAFLDENAQRERPFFLYVAYTAAHWPLHAPAADVERFQGSYSMGWDELRLRRHARMKKLGVVNPDWRLSPRHPNVPAWEDEPHKEWQQRRMEVYAAQISRMDRGVGRIVESIEKQGLLENTLILYQHDNGGCHVEYAPDRKGPYLPEKTRDGRPMRPGNLPEIMPGPEDTYQSYGYGWANASNTPFRLFKKYDHEGGVMTPLIVHWPAGVPDPGGFRDELSHVIDLAPTFCELGGAAPPEKIPFDGKSLVPVLRGGDRAGHEMLYWKWSEGRAVRQGRWKLVAIRNSEWELYDIEADGTELNNLASENQETVARLASLWNSWNERGAS